MSPRAAGRLQKVQKIFLCVGMGRQDREAAHREGRRCVAPRKKPTPRASGRAQTMDGMDKALPPRTLFPCCARGATHFSRHWKWKQVFFQALEKPAGSVSKAPENRSCWRVAWVSSLPDKAASLVICGTGWCSPAGWQPALPTDQRFPGGFEKCSGGVTRRPPARGV